MKSRVTVDGVVAVVDGLALAEGRVAGDMDALAAQRAGDDSLDHDDPVEEVFEDQIACADLVIVTKGDLVDAAGTARADAIIAEHLPRGVKLVRAVKGVVDPGVLMGLGLAVEDDIENRRTHHDDELDHDHDDFDSFVVEMAAVADPAALAARVEKVAEAEGVLRVKGFVEVAGKPMRLLVQGVGTRVSHYYDRAWGAGEARRSGLVVIGLKGLDQDRIRAALAG
jgi:cobalamin biosynthesis protein CobW